MAWSVLIYLSPPVSDISGQVRIRHSKLFQTHIATHCQNKLINSPFVFYMKAFIHQWHCKKPFSFVDCQCQWVFTSLTWLWCLSLLWQRWVLFSQWWFLCSSSTSLKLVICNTITASSPGPKNVFEQSSTKNVWESSIKYGPWLCFSDYTNKLIYGQQLQPAQ